MEEENATEEEEKFWYSDKPAALIVIAGVAVFPFVLAYWGFAKVTKNAMFKRMDRRWMKSRGRRMNGVEQLLYKFELDKKFMI